jgi:lipopolysaccharide transport system ATP-binding protein
MSDIVIRVENLGKRYRIGERERYLALRDVLTRAISAPARLFRTRKPSSPNGDPTHIWALKDVSFEIRQGEVVGIIGRNGAGKTTLLKILARVSKPTTGHAEVRGRMGSLLEVGTGFHPELTGRENTFLNGAILGMSKKEITRKFDEIVAFAEIEKFIDTPVKHYSSGMQVRLAFAVAAHLDAEILLVDEVLAVGDAVFQRKCTGKIGQVARGGRTVLFVSHSMAAISSLCRRALLLHAGATVRDGPTGEVVAAYMEANTNLSGEVAWDAADRTANNGRVHLVRARILGERGVGADVEIDRPVTLEMDFEVFTELNVCSSIHVLDKYGVCAFVSGTPNRLLRPGLYRDSYHFPANLFNDGPYSVTLFLLTETTRVEIMVEQAISFTVNESRGRGEYLGVMIGCVRPQLEVSHTSLSATEGERNEGGDSVRRIGHSLTGRD